MISSSLSKCQCLLDSEKQRHIICCIKARISSSSKFPNYHYRCSGDGGGFFPNTRLQTRRIQKKHLGTLQNVGLECIIAWRTVAIRHWKQHGGLHGEYMSVKMVDQVFTIVNQCVNYRRRCVCLLHSGRRGSSDSGGFCRRGRRRGISTTTTIMLYNFQVQSKCLLGMCSCHYESLICCLSP